MPDTATPATTLLAITRPDARTPAAAQLLLQIWLSPAFPVGAFAYSHGLEKAAEFGWIHDRASLQNWLSGLIEHGSLRNDLILLAAAWRAITAGDDGALADVAELSAAFQPSAERHLETTQQGRSFLGQITSAWACDAVVRLAAVAPGAIGYPVAVGVVAAGHAVPLRPTLSAYGLAFIGNMVAAAIRLSVIGQSDGQRIIAALLPAVETAATTAAAASLDDLGGAAFRSDIASLAHETQYTRLFRS